MCRTGGRRCPGEHDPVKVAARNARRRAKYAADKAIRMIDMNPAVVTPTPSTTKSRVVDKLGVVTTPISEADPAYRPVTVSGVLDWSNLDETSYEQFGFENVVSNESWSKQHQRSFVQPDETTQLTKAEKVAILNYTGNTGEWINAMAFNPALISLQAPVVPNHSVQPLQMQSVDDVFEKGEFLWRNTGEHLEMLKRLTTELDTALTKGPKKQRIVYRGMNRAEIDGDPDEWVKKNRGLGTEVVFDGYLSTTTDRRIAHSFLTSGVVYEILTPEGVQIAPESFSKSECEVLLPRKQRYMVVGEHKDVEGVNVVQMVAVNSAGEVLDGTNSDPVESLVTEDVIQRTKDNLHLSFWFRAEQRAVEDMVNEDDFDSLHEYLKHLEGRDTTRRAATLARSQAILQAEQYGRLEEAEKLRELFAAHPEDITAKEILLSQPR